MYFVDTHCHIHFDDYLSDAEQVVTDAAASKVKKMICVGVSLEDSQKAVDFAYKYENIWASVGAHPHDADNFLNDKDAIKKLELLISVNGSPMRIHRVKNKLKFYVNKLNLA
jgi:TatD DNase family protein